MRLSVVRRESLGAHNTPSSGESKSSMRKMAEATQIAHVVIDRYTTALRGESRPKPRTQRPTNPFGGPGQPRQSLPSRRSSMVAAVPVGAAAVVPATVPAAAMPAPAVIIAAPVIVTPAVIVAAAVVVAAMIAIAAAIKSRGDDDPAAPTIRYAPAIYVAMVGGSASARRQGYARIAPVRGRCRHRVR